MYCIIALLLSEHSRALRPFGHPVLFSVLSIGDTLGPATLQGLSKCSKTSYTACAASRCLQGVDHTCLSNSLDASQSHTGSRGNEDSGQAHTRLVLGGTYDILEDEHGFLRIMYVLVSYNIPFSSLNNVLTQFLEVLA